MAMAMVTALIVMDGAVFMTHFGILHIMDMAMVTMVAITVHIITVILLIIIMGIITVIIMATMVDITIIMFLITLDVEVVLTILEDIAIQVGIIMCVAPLILIFHDETHQPTMRDLHAMYQRIVQEQIRELPIQM